MDIYKKLFTITTAAALIMSQAAPFSAIAAETQAIQTVTVNDEEEVLPDWVPSNYMEAMDFTNIYGATHAESNYICVVQERSKSEDDYYDIKFSGAAVDKNEYYEYSNKDFYLEDVEIPEVISDNETYKYERFMIDGKVVESDHYYKVIVFTTLFFKIDVTFESGKYEDGKPVVDDSTTYTFGNSTASNEKIELDVFGFLPDSVEEFLAFKNKYGEVSVHDDYVVYCDDVLYAAGNDLEVQNSEPDKLKEVMSYTVTEKYPSTALMPGGDADMIVKVYKAQEAGEVELNFIQTTNSPNRSYDKIINNTFVITELEEESAIRFKITENVKDIPKWIPTNYEDAVAFDKQYGATHIEDDYVCCVHKVDKIDREKIIEFDTEKLEEINTQVYNKIVYDEKDEYSYISYEIEVFRLAPSTSLEIFWIEDFFPIDQDVRREIHKNHKLTFIADKTGKITETDILGWMPDCLAEAEEFQKNNGTLSIHDDMIIYCDVSDANGYILPKSESGTARLNSIAEYSIYEPDNFNYDIFNCAYIHIFHAERPGTATVIYGEGQRKGLYSYDNMIKTAFRFDNDLNAKQIELEEIPPEIMGDCNYDGVVGMADYVTLKRYLQTGKGLEKSLLADLNHDNRINVFDFIEMKKLILNGNTVFKGIEKNAEPILAAVYNNKAWGLQQEVTVYDTNGMAFSLSYGAERPMYPDNTYSKLINMKSDSEWYNQLVEITKSEKAVKSAMPDDVLRKTKELAANITEYAKETGKKSTGARMDGGTTTYYLIGKDEDGKPVCMEICSEGDTISLTDCEEIREYIQYATYQEFFMYNSQFNMIANSGK